MSNNDSDSNSDSSSKGKLVGFNNSNSENSLSASEEEPVTAPEIPPADDEEIDISFGYEGKNYTSYMKTMRHHYDKELFDGKNIQKM